MKKSVYAARHGITVRPVTPQDIQGAKTDYQRSCKYIFSYKGLEWYSRKATLADMMDLVRWYSVPEAKHMSGRKRK